MFRNIAIFTLGLASIASLNAGQIQIGQTLSGINDGLTSSYIGLGSGSFTLSNYDTTVFQNAHGTSPATPVPFQGYSNNPNVSPTVDNVTNGVLKDVTNGITFDMISTSPSSAPTDNDAWVAGGSTGITVPVGIFGVTTAWTMLNDLWGSDPSDTIVQFNFGTSATDTSGDVQTVILDLQNGVQIRDAVDCSNVGVNCPALGSGGYAKTLSSSSTLSNMGNSSGAIGSVGVLTNNLYTSAYNLNTGNSPYLHTVGNLVLDDQGFNFGNTFAGKYLVSIQISSPGTSFVSADALSAVTVTTGAIVIGGTPEPSTMVLFMGGFGLLGFARMRRNRK
jgi:hypothetical protein